jgi:hypothetical protein
MRFRIGTAAALLVITAGVAGCTEPQQPDDSLGLTWTTVTLPARTRPTTFGTDGQQLIIGGRNGPGPWLAKLSGDDLQPVSLGEHSPYSKIAEFVSVGIYRNKIAALGNVHGGAHGNSRWTVWTGDTDALTEYPQSLETFGGVDGGDLAAIVINRDGPLITGSRLFGSGGLDAAVWLPDGTPVGKRWVLQPSPGTALDSTPTVQVSVQAATATSGRVVLAGSSTHLGNGVHQIATIWDRPDGQHWKRIELPVSGRRSEALSISCPGSGAGSDCLVAGTVDGHLAAWTLNGERPTAVRGLPAATVDPHGPRPAVITTAAVRAIAYASGSGTALTVNTQGRWRRAPGPSGHLVSATGHDRTAYVITQSGQTRHLQTAPLPR